MNFEERKNLTYRILACLILLITAGVITFAMITVIKIEKNQLFLDIVTLMLTALFLVLEIVFILRGGKKESILYKICFEPNGTINHIPLIVVIIGSLFGLGLISLGISVYFVRFREVTIRTSMLVIISVAVYLVTNCLVYFLYLLMFKKREINLENFIK